MKKLQCAECRQTFWVQFRKEEEDFIRTGEWIGVQCPKCEHPWAVAAPVRQKNTRRKKDGRKAGVGKKRAGGQTVPPRRKRKSRVRKLTPAPSGKANV